jgi:hypothetical protein
MDIEVLQKNVIDTEALNKSQRKSKRSEIRVTEARRSHRSFS